MFLLNPAPSPGQTQLPWCHGPGLRCPGPGGQHLEPRTTGSAGVQRPGKRSPTEVMWNLPRPASLGVRVIYGQMPRGEAGETQAVSGHGGPQASPAATLPQTQEEEKGPQARVTSGRSFLSLWASIAFQMGPKTNFR